MKLLKSKNNLEIPKLFLVSNKEKLEEVPIGVPFIFGDSDIEDYLVRLLEYEVLYQAAVRTGYPFNFKKILKENGFDDIEDFGWSSPTYIDFRTEGKISDSTKLEDLDIFDRSCSTKFKDYVRDSSCYVHIEKLKALNVFPVWLDKIEDAIKTNIHNFAIFNPNMYNKKLEGMYGGLEFTAPNKNLIIIDISGSIPKAVSSTCLTLAKNLAESFYADLMITGSKTTLYEYENIHNLDVKQVYDDNGMDNDQTWFKKLVTSNKKVYKTCIAFGDNHSPCDNWRNSFNRDTRIISRENGQKINLWEIDKLISFHTTDKERTAGYADWFKPKEVEKIDNWVTYLNK